MPGVSSSQGYGFLQAGGAPHLIVGGDPNRAMAMVKDSAGVIITHWVVRIPSGCFFSFFFFFFLLA